MADTLYYGEYVRIDTLSKAEGSVLVGANCLVGDVYSIEFAMENDQKVAWMKNRFDQRVAFFDEKTSQQLSLCEARGWALQALLSFVAYDEADGGHYWGEAALICFDKRNEEEFTNFVEQTGKRLADGIRPSVTLGSEGVQKVIATNGEWKPTKTIPLPDKMPGTALVKTRLLSSEKLIEQGRAKNKGCYLGSILFFVAIIVGIVFGLRSCGVF